MFTFKEWSGPVCNLFDGMKKISKILKSVLCPINRDTLIVDDDRDWDVRQNNICPTKTKSFVASIHTIVKNLHPDSLPFTYYYYTIIQSASLLDSLLSPPLLIPLPPSRLASLPPYNR